MFFSRIALFALPAIVAASAIPRDSINHCSIDNTQMCCNNLQSANALSADHKQQLGIAGFDVDNAIGQFGVTCSPATVPVGVAGGAVGFNQAGCNNQNLCCQQSTANGLFGINCTPAIVNGRR